VSRAMIAAPDRLTRNAKLAEIPLTYVQPEFGMMFSTELTNRTNILEGCQDGILDRANTNLSHREERS
jgi:hypothetical protein